MAYAVSFKSSALKQIQKLSNPLAKRILDKATLLGVKPRPSGCVKLAGSSDLWRIRVGDYRIVYLIDDAAKKVDIHIVAHRREVYRDT